jgi:hypothetical protein
MTGTGEGPPGLSPVYLSATCEGKTVRLSDEEMSEAEEAVHERAEDLRCDAGPEREDY